MRSLATPLITCFLLVGYRDREPKPDEKTAPLKTFRASDVGSRIRAVLSRDGKTLVAGGSRGSVIFDIATWSAKRNIGGVFRALSPDGAIVAAVNDDGFLELWDAATGQVRVTAITGTWLHNKTNAVYTVVFSSDGKVMATAPFSDRVALWDPLTLKQRWKTDNLYEQILVMTFSEDARLLAIGTREGHARIWDVTNHQEVCRFEEQRTELSSAIECLAFSPDGTMLATGSANGTARLWDIARRQQMQAFELGGGPKRVRSVAFSMDGAMLAAGYDIGTEILANGRVNEMLLKRGAVQLWEAATGKRVRSLEFHRAPVTSVLFVPDSKRLITADESGNLALWDVSLSEN